MIIVSDTTPINYLVLIGQIDLLEELFGRVIIPPAVFDEFHHPGTPEIVSAWVDAAPPWLEVKPASSFLLASVRKLGAGEREAIALAKELGADAVLMDDRKATKEAKRNNLIIIGTLAILERAAQRGLLNLPEAIERLSQTNFRLPPIAIIEEMLRRDAERKE